MASFAPVHFSGSTSGKPILIAATATPGTIIHTAIAGATQFDEVYLWITNVSAAAVTFTGEISDGTIVAPDDLFAKLCSIPANSPPIPILTGLRYNGGMIIRMFASSGTALTVSGIVNRYTP